MSWAKLIACPRGIDIVLPKSVHLVGAMLQEWGNIAHVNISTPIFPNLNLTPPSSRIPVSEVVNLISSSPPSTQDSEMTDPDIEEMGRRMSALRKPYLGALVIVSSGVEGGFYFGRRQNQGENVTILGLATSTHMYQ